MAGGRISGGRTHELPHMTGPQAEPSPVILDSGRTAKCSTSLIQGRAR